MSSFLNKWEQEKWSVDSKVGLDIDVHDDVSTDKQVFMYSSS